MYWINNLQSPRHDLFTVVILQDSVDLDIKDKNGKTPYMLAAGRKHEEVVTFLKKHIDKSNSVLAKIDLK